MQPRTDGPERLYTVDEVRRLFDLDRSAFYRAVREGRFPRPRRTVAGPRYTEADLAAYLLFADRWPAFPAPQRGARGHRRGKRMISTENRSVTNDPKNRPLVTDPWPGVARQFSCQFLPRR